MTLALISKEFRQHWLPLLLIAGLMGLGFLLLLAGVAVDDSGSWFEAVRRFLIAMLPLGALVLGNRLVVREYQSKTQLFIESLPVSRGRMILVKYLLGFALIVVCVTLVFAFSILLSLRSEVLTRRFLAIMAARAYTFAWCLYSFFFMMGLMGRYRVAIYLMGYFALFALDTMTSVELARFGPFVLVDDQFAFERTVFPQHALQGSLAFGAGLVLLTLALALVREGTIATLMAEKMTHREKITVAAVVIAFLIGVSVYDERVEKEPFDLPDSTIFQRGDVTVSVSLGDDGENEEAQRLAQLVADEASAMQQYLALSDPPPIFISQWSELDGHHFERADLQNAEGLLVRANFRSHDWDDGRFLNWLLRELLICWSGERLSLEPNLWVLDGFCLSWTCRQEASVTRDLDQLRLRAAYGSHRGFSSQDPHRWLQFRERVGDRVAAAVAWQGLETLKARQGEQRYQAFLQAVMDCSVPADVRGTVHGWLHPVASLLQQHAGIVLPGFVANWSKALSDLQQEHQDELDQIPRIGGQLTIKPLSDYTRVVDYQFESEPAPESGRFALLYAELPAFGNMVEPSEISREDGLYPDQRDGELPETYNRGDRLLSTFATHVDSLGCEIISGWTRTEMD